MKDGFFRTADELVFERLLATDLETAWRFLTDPDKRALWLCGGVIEPRAGGKVMMVFHNDRLSPIKETVPEAMKCHGGACFEGEVTEWNPPHVLAHTWDGSLVRFELEEAGPRQVRLTLTHAGMASLDADSRTGTLAGWHTHFDILTAQLTGVTPPGFFARHAENERHYAGSPA